MTRYRHGFWFVLVAFLLGGVLTTEVRAQSVIDLCDLVQRGNQINVDIVSVRSNRRTGQVTMGLRLANVSGESVPPPIYLAIQNITSQDATVDNASGVDVSGIPFFVVGQELTEIPPGDTVDVSVIFGNVGRSRFTFDAMAFGVAESFFVTMTDPLSQTLTNQTDIPVSGNISSSATEVSVNGVPGVILGDTWSIGAVPLTHEGTNSLSALAINSDGAVANVATTVTRDTTPPTVTFTSPLAGATVYVESIAVTGAYNDPVAGLLSNEEPTATINGIPASSSNGAFLASAVPLVMGLNTLAATVTDQAGNARTVTRDVIYDPAAVRKIVVVSGDNQAAPISEQLAQPLVAQLLDEAGQPVGGETVFFRVRQSNGVFGDLSRLASAESDVDGFAQIDFVVGSRTGVGCNRVEATAVDFVGPAIFVSTSTGGTADKINAATGERQVAAVDTQAPQAMCVLVTDIGNNPLSGIKVIFEVTDGGGHFLENGTATLGATTDVTGRTQATFVTGPLAGIDINMVSARIEEGEGSDASPVIFTVTGVNAGDPDETTFSGVVIDHTETPMPGVMITIGEESTTTDPEGQFSLSNIPVGPIHLVANGSTTSVPGEWPTLAYEHTTVAGIDNTLGMPIRLLPIDQEFPEAGGDETVELTMVEVPGFKLTIFPNSVQMPDGSPTGLVSVTQVRTDTIPMAPGDGMQPNFIITVQPPGVHFDPPAQVTYPNTDGFNAGSLTNLYSFDHDLARFVMIGPGRVSEDATVVVSEPGFGIVKGGWHCAGPSVPQGHAAPVDVKLNGEDSPEAICLADAEMKTLTAVGTPQPPLDPAQPYTWTIPAGVDLVAGTLNSASITVKANTAFPSGAITVKYTCESGAMDTATLPLAGAIRIIKDNGDADVNNDPTQSILNISNLPTSQKIADGDGHEDPDNFKVEINCPGVMGNTIPAADVSVEALKPNGSSFAPARKLQVALTRVGMTDIFRSKYLRLVVDGVDKAAANAQTILTDWDQADDTIEIIGQKIKAEYSPGGMSGTEAEATVCDNARKFTVAVHWMTGATGMSNAAARQRVLKWFRRVYAQACMRPVAGTIQEVAPFQNFGSIANDDGNPATGGGAIGLFVSADRGVGGIVTWSLGVATVAGETPKQTADRVKARVEAEAPSSGGAPGDRLMVSTFENNAIFGAGAKKSADLLFKDPGGGTVTVTMTSSDVAQDALSSPVDNSFIVWNGTNFVTGSFEMRGMIRNYDTGSNVFDIFVTTSITTQVDSMGNSSPLRGAAMFKGGNRPANEQGINPLVNNAFSVAAAMDGTDANPFSSPHEIGHDLIDATHVVGENTQLMRPGTSGANALFGSKRIAVDTRNFDGIGASGGGAIPDQVALMRAHPLVGP